MQKPTAHLAQPPQKFSSNLVPTPQEQKPQFYPTRTISKQYQNNIQQYPNNIKALSFLSEAKNPRTLHPPHCRTLSLFTTAPTSL